MLRMLSMTVLVASSRAAGPAPSWPAGVPNYFMCSSAELGKGKTFCDHTLDTATRVKDVLSHMTMTQKCANLADNMGGNIAGGIRPGSSVKATGWPGYNWNTECLHGLGAICLTKGGVTRCPTIFGAPPGLGATFNNSVPRDLGLTIGDEIRAYNNANGHRDYQNRPVGVSAWGPNLNIYRDPRWGRNVEVPSEDPYHSGQYGVAYTKALQWGTHEVGKGKYIKAIGALKHYTMYSVEGATAPDGAKITRGGSYFEISSHDVEDTYLPQFKAPVVEAQSLGYMCSYAALTNAQLVPDSGERGAVSSAQGPISDWQHRHSEPLCASKFFNDQKMVKEYGFKGYVQSDCGAVSNEYGREKWAANATDAAAKTLINGRMNSECGNGMAGNNICKAIGEGLATEAQLDANVGRSFELLINAGVFDPPGLSEYTKIPFETINSEAAQARSLEAARQSLVLLKNAKQLPLKKGAKIAMIGPHSQTQKDLAGNYFTDIGVGTCSGPTCITTVEKAMSTVNGAAVTTVLGCPDRKCASISPANMSAALAAAKGADVVVMAMGLDGSIEGEGHDRLNITLPGMQKQLIKSIIAAAAGKPIVLLLFNGGTIAIEEIQNEDIAIVECFYPGASGGQSVAESLFGVSNRWGKMPFTYVHNNYTELSNFVNMNMTNDPAIKGQIGRTYKYIKDQSLVAWPFGFGLSLTTFEIAAPSAAYRVTATEPAAVSVKVSNTGKVAGDEVVFLFHNASAAQTAWDPLDPQALKQLLGFQRVTLAAGASTTVHFNVTADKLSVVDKEGTRHSLAGQHELILSRGHGKELHRRLALDLGGAKRKVISTLTPEE